MWLESSSFGNGAVIPKRHTCDGDNLSPPLRWGDVPGDARSLAIICVDPDAPNGAFYHWAACNIAVSKDGLAEAEAATKAFAQGVNDFGKTGYGGRARHKGIARITMNSGCLRSRRIGLLLRPARRVGWSNVPRERACSRKLHSSDCIPGRAQRGLQLGACR